MKYKLIFVAVSAAVILFLPMLALFFPIPYSSSHSESSLPLLNETFPEYFVSSPDTGVPNNAEDLIDDNGKENIYAAVESIDLPASQFEDTFRILDTASGKVVTVNTLEYIRGAIAAEMPFTFHSQALIAQGIAAYTNAVRSRMEQQQNPDPLLKGADLSADPDALQSWTNEERIKEWYGIYADTAWKKICEAADTAAEYLLIYEGAPIMAAYCSMSCGNTESAENVWGGSIPYLTAVESSGDLLAPNSTSVVTLSPEVLVQKLNAAGYSLNGSLPCSEWFGKTERSESGYVLKQQVGEYEISGRELRTLFSLRSSCFDVSFDGSAFHFTVSGYGHGVGLSQYGADYMARQGSDFIAILQHYYPGVLIAHVK